MIPQPKTVMSHQKLQELFAAKYPTGAIELSENVGGAKRRYAVRFTDGGKWYSYAGTAKDVAGKLELLPQYAIVRAGIAGNCVEHWNKSELEEIAAFCNSEEYKKKEIEIAHRWENFSYVHPVFQVVLA